MGTLVLERLGPPNDALVGDLAEEYRAGRSPVWYWWQVLVAIAFQIRADVRHHWIVMVRSILSGLLLVYVLGWLLFPITMLLTWWILLYPSGVILMQFQVGLLIHLANSFCGSVVAGLVVARWHERHRAVAILGLVLTLGVLAVGNERFYSLVRNSLEHERFVPYLMEYLLRCVVIMAGVLIGGLAHPPGLAPRNEGGLAPTSEASSH